VVKTLLDKGADIDANDNNGRTPLLQALRNGNTEVIKILLDSGARE
jgi:ankyrin repeat protein